VASLLAASCAAPVEEEVEEEEEGEWVSEIEEVEEVEEVALIASQEPVYGGTLTIAAEIERGFDWIGSGGKSIARLVIDQLGHGSWAKGPGGTNECPWLSSNYDASTCGQLNLLESWEQTGPLTFKGTLKKGIKFNAGLPHIKALVGDRELTTEDIAYVWDRGLNYPGSRPRMAPYIESLNIIDRYTYEWVMTKPYWDVLQHLVMRSMIYPREPIDEFGGINDWRQLIGSGPWIITDYISDASWTAAKNPDYWGYDELFPENRLPYVDTLRGLIIVDRMTSLAALRTGKIDMMGSITPDEAGVLEVSNPELQRRHALDGGSNPMFHFRMDEPPLDDPRIRQALVAAIDMQEIVDDYYSGQGEAFVMVANPLMPEWYVPLEELPEDIQEIWGYSPEKARELLDEALGPGATLELPLNTTAGWVDEVTIIMGYWDAIGVKSNLNLMETGALAELTGSQTYHGIASEKGGMAVSYEEPLRLGTKKVIPGENFEDPIWEAMKVEMEGTIDPDEQWTLFEQARNHLLRNPHHIRFPHRFIYAYWQPWIGGYHGEFELGGVPGPLYARIWCDQAVKTALGR